MKIIDEKGRLFEKINIIDFLVAAFLLLLIPIYYFVHRVSTVETPKIEYLEHLETVLLTLRVEELDPDVGKLVKEGDIQIQIVKNQWLELEANRPAVKIVKIISNTPTQIAKVVGDGKVLSVIDGSGKRDLILQLEVISDRKNTGYFFENKLLKIGSTFTFSPDFYSFYGTIIGLEKKDIE